MRADIYRKKRKENNGREERAIHKNESEASVRGGMGRIGGEIPEGELKVGGMALQADGVAGLNFGHSYRLKPLDAWSLSRSEAEARKRLPELMGFLKRYVPGMENCVLVSSGDGMCSWGKGRSKFGAD